MAPRSSGGTQHARRPVIRLLAAFAAVSAAGGVLSAGLVVPAVAATGSLTSEGVDIFNELPGDLGDRSLSEATTIRWSDGAVMAKVYDQNRTVVAFDQIAPVMRDAIVAIEDDRYYSHGAVDMKGIVRALVSNAGGGGTQGASTITQQYVKNVLVQQAVEQGDSEAAAAAVEADGVEGYSRKLREMKLAIGVEKEASKDDILAGYLNVSYFQNNLYGVEAAAQYYFSKSAADLTLAESAVLAGMVQNPAAYNPVKYLDASTARRNVVLKRMLEVGKIDQAAYDEAVASPLTLAVNASRQGCLSAGTAAYFCDYVVHVIESDPTFGETPEARRKLLRSGGLDITTSLSPLVQNTAQESVNRGVNPGQEARAAASIVEPGTGKILAMAQDTTYSPDDQDQIGVTTLNYNVSLAMGGTQGFQQGSTFKAFTLATWLKSGRSLDSTVAAPSSGNDPFSAFTSCGEKLRGGRYPYSNSEGGGTGTASVRTATSASINTAFVAMEKQLDLCDIAATAQSLGVYKGSATPADTIKGAPNTFELDKLPSMTLGVNLVTPLSVAGAYAAFAADGLFCKPTAITQVLDTNGQPLQIPSADCQQVLDQNVARNVTEALRGGWTNGTAARVGKAQLDGRQVASKTGTTNKSNNTWFAAYTPQMAGAVWVGHHAGEKSLNGERINGVRRARVFGATIAGPIWADIVGPSSAAMNLPKATFTPGTSQGLRTTTVDGKIKVPSVVGRSVSSARSALEGAGFKVSVASGTVPSESVPEGQVASQSARSANAGATITITRSSGPAPVQTQEPEAPPATSDSPGIQLPTELPNLPTELPQLPGGN